MEKSKFISIMAASAAKYGKVEFKEVQKVNETYYGMYIDVVNKPTPVVNLDTLYDFYCETEDIEACLDRVNEILTTVFDHSIILENITNWEWVKEHLYLKLFGHVVNGICRPVADLYLVPYVDLPEDSNATVCVTPDMLDSWEVSIDDVFDAAIEAQPKIRPVVIRSLAEIFGIEDDDCPMYVVTCEDHYCGASAILYPGVAERIQANLGDFYIIPASVHETLVVPKLLNDDLERLTNMVKDVNEKDVPDGDKLSDSVYVYDFEDKTIKQATA